MSQSDNNKTTCCSLRVAVTPEISRLLNVYRILHHHQDILIVLFLLNSTSFEKLIWTVDFLKRFHVNEEGSYSLLPQRQARSSFTKIFLGQKSNDWTIKRFAFFFNLFFQSQKFAGTSAGTKVNVEVTTPTFLHYDFIQETSRFKSVLRYYLNVSCFREWNERGKDVGEDVMLAWLWMPQDTHYWRTHSTAS